MTPGEVVSRDGAVAVCSLHPDFLAADPAEQVYALTRLQDWALWQWGLPATERCAALAAFAAVEQERVLEALLVLVLEQLRAHGVQH